MNIKKKALGFVIMLVVSVALALASSHFLFPGFMFELDQSSFILGYGLICVGVVALFVVVENAVFRSMTGNAVKDAWKKDISHEDVLLLQEADALELGGYLLLKAALEEDVEPNAQNLETYVEKAKSVTLSEEAQSALKKTEEKFAKIPQLFYWPVLCVLLALGLSRLIYCLGADIAIKKLVILIVVLLPLGTVMFHVYLQRTLETWTGYIPRAIASDLRVRWMAKKVVPQSPEERMLLGYALRLGALEGYPIPGDEEAAQVLALVRPPEEKKPEPRRRRLF